MAGLDLAVSCERKEDRETVKKHLGKEAVALERQGVETELGNHNRTIDNVLELSSQVYTDGAELAKQRAELENLERLQQEIDKQKQLEEQLSRQRELARHQELIRADLLRKEQEKRAENEKKAALKAQEDQEIERLKVPAENNLSVSGGIPYKLFDIAREHGEFFTKQAKGDYEYWTSRDGAVEVHASHVNVHKSSATSIELALDVAVSKFGCQLSLNGSDEFIEDVITQLATNPKYAEISLDNREHQEQLESKRLDIEIENAVDLELASITDIDISNAPDLDIDTPKPQKKQRIEKDFDFGHSRGGGMSL